MRMRQSLAEIEQAFLEEQEVAQVVAVEQVQRAQMRTRQRERERMHRHGTMRFVALVVTLIATAVLVTIAMFETLYYVMG